MPYPDIPVLAGTLASSLFIGSYLPMITKALRTRDLSSYSRSSLVLANAGNLLQTLYVLTLPIGPMWGLHSFYLVTTALMLVLHLRYHRAEGEEQHTTHDQESAQPKRKRPCTARQ